MCKFQFNYLNNILCLYEEKNKRIIPNKDQFFSDYGSLGWRLDKDQPNHWITFNVYPNKIKAFYKKIKDDEIIYYQKEIPIVPLNKLPLIVPNQYREIEIKFNETDIVEKVDSKWVKKQ